MLVEDMSRKKYSSRFEYQMFYVLYPSVTYLLTLHRILFNRAEKAKDGPVLEAGDDDGVNDIAYMNKGEAN
jgi:hypothetical protein